MINSIVPKLTPDELIALFRKEAQIGKDGSVTFSRRGVEKLTLLSKSSVQRVFSEVKSVPKSNVTNAEVHTVQPRSNDSISDAVVFEIITYCIKCTDKRLVNYPPLIVSPDGSQYSGGL